MPGILYLYLPTAPHLCSLQILSPLYSLAAANIINSYSSVPTLVSACHTSKAWCPGTRLCNPVQTNDPRWQSISSGITPLRRGFLYFLGAQTIVINLVTCITIYTQCEKVETIWDPIGTPSKCWPGAVQAVSSTFHRSMFQSNNMLTGHWLLPRRCVFAHCFRFHRS